MEQYTYIIIQRNYNSINVGMIKVENLSKSFNGRQILKDINIEFVEGKINIIIGESGSGKTVLARCMVGLLEINEGKILYEGENFSGMNFKQRKEVRKKIGMLFQGGALFDSQTCEENVMFPLMMFSDLSPKEQIERAHFCLERVNLSHAHKLFPSEISGGMKKRVAIARAIALNPKYLFCDEPNSGLDPRTSILIDNLIGEITAEFNITTVVITHDMNSVLEIGDHINFLYKGEKWWEGNRQEILKSTNKELNDFVYASDLMKRIRNA